MIEKRFENRLDKSNIKFNTLNPVWDNEKEDALNIFEMIDELNRLNSDCSNLIDDNTEFNREINQMYRENEQLKADVKYFNETYFVQEYGLDVESHVQLSSSVPSRKELLKENEQLKLLCNHRGEMVGFATSLIQDMGSEEMVKMWNDFTESMYQKWKRY